MAKGTESSQTMNGQDLFYDVENLSMWIRVTRNDGRLLPIGSFTERQIMRVVKNVTGINPLEVTVIGKGQALLAFEQGVDVIGTSMILQALNRWDDNDVHVHCVMARKKSLVNIIREHEAIAEKKEVMEKEKYAVQKEKIELGSLIEKMTEQLERMGTPIEGPSISTGIVTPKVLSSNQENSHKMLVNEI